MSAGSGSAKWSKDLLAQAVEALGPVGVEWSVVKEKMLRRRLWEENFCERESAKSWEEVRAGRKWREG